MEYIKAKENFLVPDPRSIGLGPPLDVQYEMVGKFSLHSRVPESMRSYMASITNLWRYGWFHYPFYTTAAFLGLTAVEMALKERLPKRVNKRARDPRGLGALLQEAKSAGLLRDDGFANVHERVQPPHQYLDVLIATLPNVRNRLAHSHIHTIAPPGFLFDTLFWLPRSSISCGPNLIRAFLGKPTSRSNQNRKYPRWSREVSHVEVPKAIRLSSR